MAVAYRSNTTYNSGAGTTSSIVINAPAGLQANDYMIFVCTNTGTATITPPAGWTRRTTPVNLNSGAATVAAYWKFATSSEPASYTFTLSGASGAVASIAAYSGVDIISPNAGTGTTTSSGASSGTPGGIGPQVDQPYSIQLVCSEVAAASVTVTGVSTGFTKRSDVTSTATVFVQTAIADGPVPNTRLDSPGGSASTFSGSTDANTVIYMYLRPDTSTATTPRLNYYVRASGTSVTSTNLNISPSTGGLLYVMVYIKDTTNTVTSIVSAGLVWTKLTASRGAGTPGVELWQSYASTPAVVDSLGAVTNPVNVAINYSGSVAVEYVVLMFVGAQVGTVGISSGTGTSLSGSLTTTANNAFVLSATVRDNTAGITSGGGQTLLNNITLNTTALTSFWKNTTLVASSGTLTTHTSTNVSSTNWAMVIYELVPYINKSNFFPLFG